MIELFATCFLRLCFGKFLVATEGGGLKILFLEYYYGAAKEFGLYSTVPGKTAPVLPVDFLI